MMKSKADTIDVAVTSASNLEWKARMLARGLSSGKHASKKLGVGMEFNQFRTYVQGDDIRLLDWKMYAKTRQYYIRESEVETNHSLHLTIDNSQSMDYIEDGISKMDLTKIIAGTLSYVIAQQADQFSWKCGSKDFGRSQGLKNWRRSIIELDKLNTEEQSSLNDQTSTDGIHLLLTDLYMNLDEFDRFIASQNSPNKELVVFHLVGRREESLSFDSNTKFIDLETGEEMHVNAKKYAAQYQESLGRHIHQIKRSCQNKRITYRKIYLQSDLKHELSAFFADYNSLNYR